MQIGVTVGACLFFWIISIILSARIINLAQLEGYKVVNSRKMKSIRLKLWGSAVCITLCNAIFIFISAAIANFYVQLVVQGLYAVVLLVSLTDERDKCEHQPLVYTARAKRLFCTYSVIAALLISLASVAGSVIKINKVALAFVFIPVVFALLPELVTAAIAVNTPTERRIAKKIIKNCKKTLSEKNIIKIGITGSFAKTTVKNILTTILNQKYSAYCTPSNFNTPLGICRAVNGLPKECQVFVAEMGARKAGDIDELCDIVDPTYAIITGVGSQHLATFKSRENIYVAKKELADYVSKKDNGYTVFNADNDYCIKMFEEYPHDNKIAVSTDKCLSPEGNDLIKVDDVQCDSKGLKFNLSIGEETVHCSAGLIGLHNLNNILLCVAMAKKLGLNIVQIAKGISEIAPVEHRLQTLELSTGITVIDDSYNSNEEGAHLAIEALKLFGGRKIVATQGLVEMGKEQQRINFELGESISKVADIAILIGINRDDIRLGMLSEGFCDKNIYLVEHLDNAKELFSAMLKKGDVLLLQNDLPDNY